ncbi:MerR family transcriptional regulator, partial [Pseudomonas aeruginosa]|uniref:MerR family transcriptional regulator n=1 Tax=Pseudomonas aeruginosa TaxID=287 RepID=UPI003D189CEB
MLKPQRTDGGHRLFNDADIDQIREIKRWIDNGVQVSKVKMLLSNENVDVQNGWRDQQETLLTYLQSGNLHPANVDQRARSGLPRPDTHHTSVYSS